QCSSTPKFAMLPADIHLRYHTTAQFPLLHTHQQINNHTLAQWDSFKLWESFLAGCVVAMPRLETFDLKMPVMPTHGEHYIGFTLNRKQDEAILTDIVVRSPLRATTLVQTTLRRTECMIWNEFLGMGNSGHWLIIRLWPLLKGTSGCLPGLKEH